MTVYTAPVVLSASANYIVNNGNELHILTERPADYSEVATYSIGSVAMVPADYTLNTTPTGFTGVELEVEPKSITPTATDTVKVIAVVDTANQDILALHVYSYRPVVVDTVSYTFDSWFIGFKSFNTFDRSDVEGSFFTQVVADEAINYLNTNADEMWFVSGYSESRATNLTNQIIDATGFSAVIDLVSALGLSEITYTVSALTVAASGRADHVVLNDSATTETLFVQDWPSNLVVLGQSYEIANPLVIENRYMEL